MRTLLLVSIVLMPFLGVGQERDRQKFLEKQRDVLLEAGQRHLELGLWCRDRGLTTQAASELIRAVEISDAQHRGARAVLSIMRRHDDAFWKKRKKGTAAGRKSYGIKAAKARKKDQEALLTVADWGWKRKIFEEAFALYEGLVRENGEALEFDSKGRVVLEFGAISEGASERLRGEAITINERLYLRDEFLSALPEIGEIHEVDAGDLRVRSPMEMARVEELHAMGLALLPLLEDELEARPARKLNLFVFPTREGYEGWLDAVGFGAHRVASGLADARSFTAIVCAEGRDHEEVAGIALHELAHLFWYGVSPSIMPDWFNEGFAEMFGGNGTHAWDGETLTVGGKMADYRLEPLRAGTDIFPLRELLVGSALGLLTSDRERGLRFYAQSWAFLRFLREGAGKDVRRRYETWVAMCAGSAAGANARDARMRDTQPAAALFEQTFGSELEALETNFLAWLETL